MEKAHEVLQPRWFELRIIHLGTKSHNPFQDLDRRSVLRLKVQTDAQVVQGLRIVRVSIKVLPKEFLGLGRPILVQKL